MSEELGFEKLAWDRGAVHLHEGALLPRAFAVDRAREELFSHSGLAEDEHRRGAGLRHPPREIDGFQDGGTLTHDSIESKFLLDARGLALLARLQRHRTARRAEEAIELREIDRLEEDVADAQLERLGRLLGIPVGEHDDLELGPVFFQAADRVALLLEGLGDGAGEARRAGSEIEEPDLTPLVAVAPEVLGHRVRHACHALAGRQVPDQLVAVAPWRHDDADVQIHEMDAPERWNDGTGGWRGPTLHEGYRPLGR